MVIDLKFLDADAYFRHSTYVTDGAGVCAFPRLVPGGLHVIPELYNHSEDSDMPDWISDAPYIPQREISLDELRAIITAATEDNKSKAG